MGPAYDEHRLIAHTFFVDPLESVVWYKHAADDSYIQDLLKRIEESTAIDYIEVATQLLLTSEGWTVAGDFRMTWPAIRQVCRMLCPGLGNVIADLSGYIPRKKNPPASFYSVESAVEAYNAVLSRRFDFIAQGTRMLISSNEQQIDAVLGRTYQRLSNIEFYERVQSDLGGTLMQAAIAGRRLYFWRQTYTPVPYGLFDNPLLGFIRFGVFAKNYESGDGSILLCPAIGFGDPAVWAVRPPCPVTRVRHAGSTFPVRFQSALAALRPKDNWHSLLSERISALGITSLGFPERSNADMDNRIFRRLAESIKSAGLPISFARRVVRRTLYSGGSESPDLGQLISATRNQWTHRSQLDLLLSLIVEAAESDHPFLRERAERHAYRLLIPTEAQELFHVNNDDEITE